MKSIAASTLLPCFRKTILRRPPTSRGNAPPKLRNALSFGAGLVGKPAPAEFARERLRCCVRSPFSHFFHDRRTPLRPVRKAGRHSGHEILGAARHRGGDSEPPVRKHPMDDGDPISSLDA